MKEKITASFVSLGCFKNVVDTEVLGGLLEKKGVEVVSSYEDSDWIIINTCGFIQPAKEESIEEILRALEKREQGEAKHVAVFGCLTQRYIEDLKLEFTDVDVLWGVNDVEQLAGIIAGEETGDYGDRELFLYDDKYERIVTTTPNVTFIKISEGCDMKCSFCAIPQIRGPYRSREISSIVAEAQKYKEMGFSEINLISQNSTYFGKDRSGKSELPLLLKELSKIGIPSIRVLYLMPEEVDEHIIKGFAHPSVIPYFDLPFQHVSAGVLKRMNRGGGYEKNLALIAEIRKRFKGAVIRSSFIVGFPGETEEDFMELVRFAGEAKIERIGVFGYSQEESTGAFDLPDAVAADVIELRREHLMDISDENMAEYNERLVGTVQEFFPLGAWEGNITVGRITSQAPDTDGITLVNEPFLDDYRAFHVEITDFQNELLHGERK